MLFPAVSVIVPTLNEAARIERLVLALRAQDYQGALQILVCDGKSDDETAQLACVAGATLVSCERGVSRQRNAGARAATGELLIFMDADCLPTPDFARRVMSAYQRLPFAVACPWFVAHDGGVAARLAYFVFDVLFFGGQSWLRAGSGVCLISPRRVWERVGGFDEKLHLGEDVHYLRRACPRFGLHRQLLVPLETSGRRFARVGVWRLLWFYARISPLLFLGRWARLQKHEYASLNENRER